jgi:hypothetical protein
MLFIIARALRCLGGAPVIGRERTSVTRFMIKSRAFSRPCAAAGNRGEELPELVERAHIESGSLRPLNRLCYPARNAESLRH